MDGGKAQERNQAFAVKVQDKNTSQELSVLNQLLLLLLLFLQQSLA
jgi:hypothetical protein